MNADLSKCRANKELHKYFENVQEKVLQGKGLILSGPVGVGKTCSLVVIARELLKQSCREIKMMTHSEELTPTGQYTFTTILFTSSNRLFRAIFNKDRDLIDYANECRCLIIDDFGREYYHDFPFSEFEEIIDYRYANLKPVYVSTNLSATALNENKNFQRVVDRWRECCDVIQISGKSMRKNNE